jgi:hypothetical protein
VTRMLFVVAIALAQPSWISVHAADVSAEAKAAVEEAITELGCSMDVGDEIEANGDGYKAEYVLCADGPRRRLVIRVGQGPQHMLRANSEPVIKL